MAAITFKFGDQDQITELDAAVGAMSPEQAVLGEQLAATAAGPAGLAGVPEPLDYIAEVSADAINTSHAGLESMRWLRMAVAQAMEGRQLSLRFEGRHAWLHIDPPIAVSEQPAWNPSSEAWARVKLLSWTAKMGTPSFSLPAGPGILGGSCPGASAGMTVVPVEELRKLAPEVRRLTGYPLRVAQAICQHCYAEGGQYGTGLVQFAQLMRFAWVKRALEDGTFVDTMVWAIRHADFKLAGGTEKVKTTNAAGAEVTETIPVRGEADGRLYFRIHDSGDFFSPAYIAAWKAVAEALPEVTFWAPSRCWLIQGLRDAVDKINGTGGTNLVIRPSAYHTNEPPPAGLGPGWAAGSTVFSNEQKPVGPDGEPLGPMLALGAPYNWDCQAYATDSGKVTCRDATSPFGTIGCRACWRTGGTDDNGPGLIVNYTLH